MDQLNESNTMTLEQEALGGNIEAQNSLARMYSEKGDTENEIMWSRIAADNGCAIAQLRMSVYLRTSNPRESFAYIGASAICGNVDAEFELGLSYAYGEGTDKDPVKSFKWTMKAAEKGHFIAEYEVGRSYFHGKGKYNDIVKAFKWMTKSAQKGYVCAEYYLGCFYFEGLGVDKDTVKGIMLLEKASKQGYSNADYALGRCFSEGNGIEIDMIKSLTYFDKAGRSGNVKARCFFLTHCRKYGMSAMHYLRHSKTRKTIRKAMAENGSENPKEDMKNLYECDVCGKHDSLMCVGCGYAFYCGKACQTVDWKKHKKTCHKNVDLIDEVD
jgi:TPR repeat protein